MTIDELIAAQQANPAALDDRLMDKLRKIRKKEPKRFGVWRPKDSQFPELHIDIPKSWPYVELAPFYDVHRGHRLHNRTLFHKHWKWMRRTPYIISFDGGDFIENASKLSVGAGVYEQEVHADAQAVEALLVWASLWHKTAFKLPGNHEARTHVQGIDIAAWIASVGEVPYFPDVCFCTIHFKGQHFRLFAHHGTGTSTTAGAQRMAARKMIGWAKTFDLYWTGHLHADLVDPVYQTDFDQRSQRTIERTGLVIISPSYLNYYGGYAATKLYPPGRQGLTKVRLNPDGRMDASIYARGKRL